MVEQSKPNPVIFAVTLNWNGLDDTISCINSLKESSLHFYKIILIDQASSDGSGEKLKRYYDKDDEIFFIQNPKNLGFSGGINLGIKKALELRAELIFIINNDTIVDKNCLEYLYKTICDYPLAAAAGPVIMYYSKPDKIWQAGGFFRKIKMGTSVPDKGKRLEEISKSVSKVSFLTGCALLFPAETFSRVGFFDTDYFFYSEDVDLSLRIKAADLNMYFVPQANVWHKIDDIAVDRTTPNVLYNLGRSSIILLRKNFSGFELFYGIILRFTVYTIFRFGQIIKGRRGWDSAYAWFKGLVHGITAQINN